MNTELPGRASAVVLAGGQSRRLGQDKRRLRLWGEGGPTLLERTVALVGGLCPDVVVVLNDPEAWPGLPGRHVADAYADGGALGGIYSGLAAAAEEHALVVACDMPLLNERLLAALLARPRDYDVLAPRSLSAGATRNRLDLETLHAIYGRGCLGPMRAALEGGRRQIASFFPEVRVAIFEPEETRAIDPLGYSFLNINTVEQMDEALRALRGE
jgi:molybdopterin-guanine dinucleotide biosynthesis protein A